ncbi:helix-turn-helix domain-containing protein [Curtobacterium sp. BRD11]|uniref:helix-turn-helix domain-containing protein n=1 Tax=Curtobacterium sp. BRD11 TaxID=2962581 RepID=UPI002882AC7E|nr:hypothetical protein [Curtobacterium sp. BRD11]MDT0211203.1 hypothetical protein [Curtobacterium sp. BRD11]
MSDWMTPEQVRDEYGYELEHLKKLRYEKRGFPYYKPTERKVLYKRSEIDAFIENAKVPTGLSS